eukprot:2123407-Pyramimonas_sp.AAC.1
MGGGGDQRLQRLLRFSLLEAQAVRRVLHLRRGVPERVRHLRGGVTYSVRGGGGGGGERLPVLLQPGLHPGKYPVNGPVAALQ